MDFTNISVEVVVLGHLALELTFAVYQQLGLDVKIVFTTSPSGK